MNLSSVDFQMRIFGVCRPILLLEVPVVAWSTSPQQGKKEAHQGEESAQGWEYAQLGKKPAAAAAVEAVDQEVLMLQERRPSSCQRRCWRVFPPLLLARRRESTAGGGSMAVDLARALASALLRMGGARTADGGEASKMKKQAGARAGKVEVRWSAREDGVDGAAPPARDRER